MKVRYCLQCASPLELGEHGGKQRLGCPKPDCGFVWWENPTPVIAAVIEYQGKIVLVRSHGWPETWFGLVSGFLEKEEDPKEGIVREIREEVGLAAEVQSVIGIYPFAMMNQVILAYHVLATGEIALGEEIAAYKLVPPERLRPWPLGTGEAVRDWLAARFPERATKE